ncbi:hypothetical protein TSUD_327890 [Trifolium subterraneum]|uniref:cysteine dioxygenase n=1 Tax=Trifolium subterraneum TaxID=3900 RepID=A0A2Z6M052_TRISU|nr:hypothetical protein TSUD_327890 [Trifolium subterraneum]
MEVGLVEQGRERVGHVNKVGYVKRVIAKKRNKPYNRRVKRNVPKALQELFDSCKQTFKGPNTVPSPQDVHKLCHILDNMKPEDVGLSRDLQFFKPGNIIKENQRVTYTTVYKCDNFSLKANKVFTAPCDTSVLYPTTGGNIHEFTAITPCAVLDVIGPPYSKEDGRDCSYYKDYPCDTFPYEEEEIGKVKDKNDSYALLEEIEMPENCQMDGIEYLGPPINDRDF